MQSFEENVLSAQQIQKWNDNMRNQAVIVSMPKFEMETKYILNKPLIFLGMPDVFSDVTADLTGIGPAPAAPLYVSKATQDAYVKVNEEGTEAAVTTIIVLSDEESPPIPQFTADHPFLFVIQENDSGTILFMGKLYDPSS